MKCKNCGAINRTEAKYCKSCGKKFSEEKSTINLMFCKDCGKEISKNAEICPFCGVRLRERKTINKDMTRGITEPRSVGTAAVLGLLFGPFGYLYLRRWGLCLGALIVSLFLGVITQGFIGPILWIFFAVHQYSIAREINEELQKNE